VVKGTSERLFNTSQFEQSQQSFYGEFEDFLANRMILPE
jgi:hypothetical protein